MATPWSKPSKNSTSWANQAELGEGWIFDDPLVAFDDAAYNFDSRGSATSWSKPSKSSTSWAKPSKS